MTGRPYTRAVYFHAGGFHDAAPPWWLERLHADIASGKQHPDCTVRHYPREISIYTPADTTEAHLLRLEMQHFRLDLLTTSGADLADFMTGRALAWLHSGTP